ncbi:hypothetical protein AB0N23_06355 [Streptomyces sp. NPDC052644]
MAFNAAYVQEIRDGFAEMLRDPAFGPVEYERLTNIEFPDAYTLRRYLEEMYAYLFEGGAAQPAPSE